MPSVLRAQTLQALRAARQFDISLDSLLANLTATPELLRNPESVAEVEAHVKSILVHRASVPSSVRSSVLPVLGNIAEAFIESMLVDCGWQPVFDDGSGFSAGHGIDLLMLDPSFTAVVAIEVKSTIQHGRWPRLNPSSHAQMTPDWLDSEKNEGMRAWDLSSGEIYVMTVQAHLGRLKWRACAAVQPAVPEPIASFDQLQNFAWLSDRE